MKRKIGTILIGFAMVLSVPVFASANSIDDVAKSNDEISLSCTEICLKPVNPPTCKRFCIAP